MIELYSVRDAARIFGQKESRLRYWIQSGFLWPSVKRGGQYFYTFEDLVVLRSAVELLDSGLSIPKVRKALAELRTELPDGLASHSELRICSDGKNVIVVDDDVAYEAETKQLVMAFAVSSINTQIADVLPIRPRQVPENFDATPQAIDPEGDKTLKEIVPTAYQLFLHASNAEERDDDKEAETYLRKCLALEPSMAAAHTNLGNILHRSGRSEAARRHYDLALLHEPEQPEARFNRANLFEESGDREMAIAEYRHVCSRSPQFADAHFNLALLLTEVGGDAQAQELLTHYLTLDSDSPWAQQARELLAG